MKKINLTNLNFELSLNPWNRVVNILEKIGYWIPAIILTIISIYSFVHFYQNGLGLAYNDARSHLDIGRRVVEGLKPGVAQLGSVWLPLPHILMTLTIWNDFMWHSGLAGAIVSMIAFVLTGILIYKFLEELNVGILGRYLGVAIFVANINILYLQSTAMTELLLIGTMTFASFELLKWFKNDNVIELVKCAFWIMLSTLVRYDGWFLLVWSSGLIVIHILTSHVKNKELKTRNIWTKLKIFFQIFKERYTRAEGLYIMFATLAGFGIFLWFMWNLLIFKDPLYFAFGPFSAKAQQDQLEAAGVLQTKHQLWLSIKFYLYALMLNSNAFFVILGTVSAAIMWLDKKITPQVKLALTTLLAPFVFNVLALYFGHSVMFIQGLSGDTWFNIRYGIMLMPSLAIFIGYLADKIKDLRWVTIGLAATVMVFIFISQDAVTIDDARVGSSQKNVSEVSGWLNEHAANEKGFVLISAASHDAIIFSSGLPMKRFIHEGTGLYWENATAIPDRWARWIIMRSNDPNDLTWKLVNDKNGFARFTKVQSYPFADIYEIQPEYVSQLNTEPVLGKQK